MSDLARNQSRNLVLSTIGGICGVLGIAAYAGAAHGSANYLGTIAPLLLAHAPALLVLSIIAATSRAANIGAAILIVGLALFCGDLIYRDLASSRLFPFAAPTGGTLMMLGWLCIAISGWGSKR
ncbi:DUF423 domain-containing protein [Daeguia caeni]|uniref:DUF423 domain-containing protein n=1 Tax=Daeguia caeni TaxID=439612 RepID=A0ABV9H8Q5_9HYPH